MSFNYDYRNYDFFNYNQLKTCTSCFTRKISNMTSSTNRRSTAVMLAKSCSSVRIRVHLDCHPSQRPMLPGHKLRNFLRTAKIMMDSNQRLDRKKDTVRSILERTSQIVSCLTNIHNSIKSCIVVEVFCISYLSLLRSHHLPISF